MSEYLIMIYEDEAAWAEATPDVTSDIHSEHGAFMEKHRAAIRGGSALHGTDTATSIRDGGVSVTDGAFAETKEALGGYYVVEAADLDEAVAVAKQVPARFGGVEVRPLRVIG